MPPDGTVNYKLSVWGHFYVISKEYLIEMTSLLYIASGVAWMAYVGILLRCCAFGNFPVLMQKLLGNLYIQRISNSGMVSGM